MFIAERPFQRATRVHRTSRLINAERETKAILMMYAKQTRERLSLPRKCAVLQVHEHDAN